MVSITVVSLIISKALFMDCPFVAPLKSSLCIAICLSPEEATCRSDKPLSLAVSAESVSALTRPWTKKTPGGLGR